MKKVSLFITILWLGCADTTNNKNIIGNWKATEWLINGNPSSNSNETSFMFNDKGEYTFTHTGNRESGKYKVENDMLFTTAEGQEEMMVKITKLTDDSLVFDMNHGGQPEVLTLLREK